MELKFYKQHEDVEIPKIQTEQSACFDLSYNHAGKTQYEGFNEFNKPIKRIFHDASIYIGPHERMLVPTGLILDIPEGYSVRLHPRSGLAIKCGLILANSEAVIDSDYVEELYILVYNNSSVGVKFTNGDRLAQGELVKTEKYDIVETKIKPTNKTNRKGGMGSTGVKKELDKDIKK